MDSSPLKILLIGDAAQLARGIGKISAVPTVNAALTQWAENRFDAIIFDMSGEKESLEQLTLLAVQAPRAPIVVVGANAGAQFAAEVVRAGAQDFLPRENVNASVLRRAVFCAIERQAERTALIQEKDDYYSVFDHLIEGVFRSTPDGHYLLANVALAHIYGYESPAELMASIKDIGRELYVEPARREDFVRLMQANDVLSGFESQIYRKDGSIIWISENCRAARDAQGRLLFYEGTVEDITQRRLMSEQLHRLESLYHSLVEAMPQGVFRRDRQGRFTFANQTYCKYHHIKFDDILGKTDFDLYPKEAAEKYWNDDVRIMEKGETTEIIEETQPIGSEEKRYHHVIKTPLRDETGNVVGLQGMSWDVTEKKHAEDQIRRTTAELARSREELRQKNQLMEDNLRMAREIQFAMMPQQYPVFPPGAPPEQSALQFTHRYQAAEVVSGDFFNVSALSDQEAGVLICDVTGHGIRAALVTAMIRALAEELKPLAHNPGVFLRKLNADLCNILKTTGSPMLTTAFYLAANWQTGLVRFANAGHPKPLLVRRADKSVRALANASGHGQPALGLFDDPPYQTTEIQTAPGDVLMLFTDGIYEVQGLNEELYSQQRLMVDVKNLIEKPTSQLFDELLEMIRAFSCNHEFEDDVCLIGMDVVRTK